MTEPLTTTRTLDWPKRLSPAQLEAATRIDAPVCILAGAGSGKTRVITHRIAWLLLEQHQAPEKILAVTFTNKAAGELRHRVDALVPGRGSRVVTGTFHGLASRLLRRYGRLVDVNPSFVIYDEDDRSRLLKRILVDEMNLEGDLARPIGNLIESWQSEGFLPGEAPKSYELFFDRAVDVYTRMIEKLKVAQALDFGSLLVKLKELVKHEDASAVRQMVRHVLVDEYQDVNAVQAEIVLTLARGADTVAVVGDDDQAIYGWRGASAQNLKSFLTAMPGAHLVKLEDNYRSTETILQAANGIIEKNRGRLGKVLRSTGAPGRPIQVIRAPTDIEEARRITGDILDVQRQGVSLNDVAVLYRTNAISRLFEDQLRQHGLPYRVVGGVRFYDRKEVKDVLATLRCALNPGSDVDTLRFLAAVPRGIGESSLTKVGQIAQKRRAPILEVLADAHLLAEAGVKDRTAKKCQSVADSVRQLGVRVGRRSTNVTQASLFDGAAVLNAHDAISAALEVSGVRDRLIAEGTLEAEGRLENLSELVSAAAAWVEQSDRSGEAGDVQSFLEAAALLSSADNDEDAREKVTLMTLHSAKGLEYRQVYLCGLEEHAFPHSRAIVDGAPRESLEEERRLAYVGITRAKERLVLSYAATRMVQGIRKARDPSRFLSEIPREVLVGDVPRRGDEAPFQAPAWAQPAWSQRPAPAPAPAELAGPRVVYDDEYAEAAQAAPRRSRLVLGDGPPADARSDDEGASFGEDAGTLRRRALENVKKRFALQGAPRPEPAAAPEVVLDDDESVGGFRKGARVSHSAFGTGVVVGVRGGGRNPSALVRFDDERQPRVIVARFLRAASDDEALPE